ncbi:MAG: glycoside hydrolase family 127 protein [Chthonomonadaceae bacterium]|nr:glycoside hydrolase family 127 protein [Chthonomonadaceae bacterium]
MDAPLFDHPPLHEVRLTGGLLAERQSTVWSTTLRTILRNCEETGRLENFRRAARRESGGHQGRYYNDSDVYKWLEACAYAKARGALPEDVATAAAEAIDAIAAAQEPDGYLNTYFQLARPEMKWKSLHAMHELYCLGHLIEAGVAWAEDADDRRLLDVSRRAADLVDRLFGAEGGRVGYPGHPELEMALLRLATFLNEPRYRTLAKLFVDRRGTRPSPFEGELKDPAVTAMNPGHHALVMEGGAYSGAYLQDHKPLREQETIEGHAVRALYLLSAAAELAVEDGSLREPLRRLWTNLLERRTYLTGGVGSSGHNEGFTKDYDLPNREAYAETCASVALAMWASRMLAIENEGAYADALETTLFNGVLAGLSEDGDRFFYANPLESIGGVERPDWYSCACCPPNIARFLGSVERTLVGVGKDALWIHVPAALHVDAVLQGVSVAVTVEGDYPWSGTVSVRVEPERPVEFALRLRIPTWCEDATLEVVGADQPAEYEDGYAVIKRTWSPGDLVRVEYAMEPGWVASHPRVLANAGRVALQRGPIVYCVEEVDLGAAPQHLAVDTVAPIESHQDGNSVVCTVAGWLDQDPELGLYAPFEPTAPAPTQAPCVPYFRWANRGPGAMQVWLRRMEDGPVQ